jgi:hypothetical protein
LSAADSKLDLLKVNLEYGIRKNNAAISGKPIPTGPRANWYVDTLTTFSGVAAVAITAVSLYKYFSKGSGKSTLPFDTLTEINAISDVRYGLLVILALSSLSVYGLIIAG